MPEPSPSPAGPRGAQEEKKQPDHKRDEGTVLVLRTLASGEERRIEDVAWYEFSEDGTKLVYAASNKSGEADGAYVMDTRTGAVTTLLKGKGNYKGISIDKAGRQVAFLSNTTDFATEQPEFTLYYWDGRAAAARAVVSAKTAGMPAGWWVSENGATSFSESGARVFFGTAPRPAPEPSDSAAADEKVVVDIWHWQDPLLQPMQLRQLEQEKRRSYQAMFDPRANRVAQLATEELPSVDIADRGDGAVAVGASNLPYRKASSWGEDGTDYYLVDVRTGEATRVIEFLPGGFGGGARLSPSGKWLTWYNANERQWFALDTRSRQQRVISSGIPHPLFDELHDSPSLPGAYGSAGWTSGDELFLVYDAHDIWALDPAGRRAARNITEGQGRRENLRFRYVRLDPEERTIDPDRDLTLSAFHLWTKQDGFYRDRVSGDATPVRLVMADKSFGQPRKAERGGTVLVTRADFNEFPDLWATDASFADFAKLSDANPHQQQYAWGSAELVSWRSGDGEVLQGVLYKPEGFDPSKKYPMMVYFYERMSDGLYNYVIPAAGSSSINTSFYVSRGYLVFNPDIPYRVGYPGESAYKAIIPGVLELVDQGFVDEKRIGVQGHSWGGYQIAYLVTKTNIFKAAEAGAPVSNMISAYGGIRWGTGMSRQFQYEKTQSRIGGTLWQAPLHFIENSPIFWADKVQTPLLMMHNDQDGAVPWEQGIEYFVALRRLGKPAWMLNYNGEDHGLRQAQNRLDWTIRLQQFFDHYLMDAPAPVWLAEGVPAIQKGRTLGLELVPDPKKPERPISQQ
jgi:dipeptidyl aminopeptidase/acylaminoacyl peptidase